MRSPRTATRLKVVGAAALGLVAALGTATPAHADITVICASVSESQGSVTGFLCTGASWEPQRGTIADRTHAYSCVFLQSSELGTEVSGLGCTPIK